MDESSRSSGKNVGKKKARQFHTVELESTDQLPPVMGDSDQTENGGAVVLESENKSNDDGEREKKDRRRLRRRKKAKHQQMTKETKSQDPSSLDFWASLEQEIELEVAQLIGSEQKTAATDKSIKHVVDYCDVSSQLHFHASTGQLEIVKSLIEENPASLESPSRDGRTILHVTASLGHLSLVVYLLQKKANVEAKMDGGATPLILACIKGQVAVVRLLLNHGAMIDAATETDGYNSLHLSVINQQAESVKMLLQHCSTGRSKFSPKDFVEQPSARGFRALHMAAVEGDASMIRMLIQEYGAAVDTQTLKLWTPLHFAAHEGQEEACRVLIELHADPKAKNEAKMKPYQIVSLQDPDSLLLDILAPKKLKGSLAADRQKPRKYKRIIDDPSKTFAERFLASIHAIDQQSAHQQQQEKENEIVIEKEEEEEPDQVSALEAASQIQLFDPSRGSHLHGKTFLEVLGENPSVIKDIQHNPESFLDLLPPELQHALVCEVQQNPNLMDEVMEIAKLSISNILQSNPELLFQTVENPLRLFRKAKTPWGVAKLLKKMEDNPSTVLKKEFQGDPEMFLVKIMQENSGVRISVIKTVSQQKPHLLPLIVLILGAVTEDPSAAAKKKLRLDRHLPKNMQRKLFKSISSRVAKRFINPDSLLSSGASSSSVAESNETKQQLADLRQYLQSDQVKAWQQQYVGDSSSSSSSSSPSSHRFEEEESIPVELPD